MDDLNEYDEYLVRVTQELLHNGNKKLCAVRDHPTANLVEEFAEILESAKDEKPLQKFFTAHPEMLAQQLGAGCRWIIPKPQLGGLLEPDFMAARLDSGGLKWVAVELESPSINWLFTQTDGNPTEKLRKGIQQVKDWRHWIENNLSTARNSPRNGGSGLVEITPRFDGLVIAGRRSDVREDDQRHRRDIWHTQNIEIHTYDWLLQEARKMVPIHFVADDNCEECATYGR
ncbi:Shedu anti-phage system protein SduA domain-containing protein [Streptomyces koyangensis]|uniref:Shedu anti-phage system protein SduA domain-containing protein n=1 Tax=Streptomyces koyangensis TaxID=188770 RepID=UPI003C2EA87F